VISNRKAAYGLTRASAADPPIPTDYLALQPYLKSNPASTRADYDLQIARKVLQFGQPDLVVLAGWMHVLSQEFLEVLNGERDIPTDSPSSVSIRVPKPTPIINLHPALPGAFDGANAIHRAYAAFQNGEISHTGVMIHRVVKEVDAGAPVIVREIPIVAGESEEALEERMHAVEHVIIVEAARKILEESTF
jgi:phosphoribosylglycinamide formyltransferase